MRILEFGKEASLTSVIEAIKSVPEKEVTLKIPADTTWFQNPVNEKILLKATQEFGKTVNFEGRPTPEVAPMRPVEVPEEKEAAESEEMETSSDFKDFPPVKDEAGFVVGGDVLEGREEQDGLPTTAAPIITRMNEPTTAEPLEGPPIVPAAPRGRWGSFASALVRKWPLALVAAFGLFVIFGAYVVFALPKADVKIVVEQRPLEREATLTATTQASTIDAAKNLIPALAKSKEQTGTAKTAATGTKVVGTTSKGEVYVYNKTAQSKAFPAGTKIRFSSGGSVYDFTLDGAVTVPACTPDSDPINPCIPNKAKVAVTSVSIGPEYNLAEDTLFEVVGTPTLDAAARNDDGAFSGGSKRDIQVVGEKDLTKLLDDLTKELTDKAKTEISSELGGDFVVPDEAVKVSVTSKEYDKKLGDEASEVSLTLAATVTATTYSSTDVKEILTLILEEKAPDGYEISAEGMETSAELSEVLANGDITFIGRVRANLLPKFDRDELTLNLAGKKPAAAESYLRAIPSVIEYEVNIWPNLPEFFRSFPRDTKRIKIEVTVQ